MTTMPQSSRICVAGNSGLVDLAIVRHLEAGRPTKVLTAPRAELGLRDQIAVDHWFGANRPEYVFLVAGTFGGILANSTRPAEFIHATVVHAAYREGVEKLLYLGSSCIYPRECPQPRKEEYLLPGPLKPTNEAYAVTRIAGIKLCQANRRQYGCDFISAMPTNLYGPGGQPRPRKLARAAGADPQVPRRQGRGERGRGQLGQRRAAARVLAGGQRHCAQARAGYDRDYAIYTRKGRAELRWQSEETFKTGQLKMVGWDLAEGKGRT